MIRENVGMNLKEEKISSMVCNEIKGRVDEEIGGDSFEVKESRKKVRYL